MPRLTWILITAIATSWLAASAAADTLKEQARKAVAAGLEAQNAGRYDEAIAQYRKAYDAVPHHEILFNLAQAHRLKGESETALGLYRRYLLVEPKGRVAADAKKWVAALEKGVAPADDARNADVTAPGAATPQPARTEPAKPGAATPQPARTEPAKPGAATPQPARTAELATTDAKSDAARTAEIAATEPARTGTATPDAASGDGARPVAPPGTSDATSAMPLGPPRDDGNVLTRRRWALVAGVAGGAFALGGAVFGAIARNRRNDAIAICGDDRRCDTDEDAARANELMATSRARGTTATVFFVLGGAGVATGAVLWFTSRESPARSALAPVIAPSVVGVTWGGQF